MKILVTIFSLLFISQVNAQTNKTAAYIAQYKEIAINEMIRSGVPAAITLAQAVLESQSGESDLVKRSNNHFGIKCKPEWTGARTFHDDDARGECFRVYDNPEASFKDHSDFLKTRAHYQFLFKLNPTDSEAWAKGLKKAGYATSPTYPQKLIKIIKDHQLDQYNLIAMAKLNGLPSVTETSIVAAPVATTNTVELNNAKQAIEVEESNQSETYIPQSKKTESFVSKKYGHLNFPEGVFTINNTGVVLAKAGTSLLALANQHNVALVKLISYNDMNTVDILEEDQLIFIERKQKKGENEFHIVKAGETLNEISQLNGVRLESILAYNKWSKPTKLVPGTKVFLIKK